MKLSLLISIFLFFSLSTIYVVDSTCIKLLRIISPKQMFPSLRLQIFVFFFILYFRSLFMLSVRILLIKLKPPLTPYVSNSLPYLLNINPILKMLQIPHTNDIYTSSLFFSLTLSFWIYPSNYYCLMVEAKDFAEHPIHHRTASKTRN